MSGAVRAKRRRKARAPLYQYALQNILYGKRNAVPLRTTSCSRGCSADLFQSHLLGHKLTHARYQAPTCQGQAILGQRVHVSPRQRDHARGPRRQRYGQRARTLREAAVLLMADIASDTAFSAAAPRTPPLMRHLRGPQTGPNFSHRIGDDVHIAPRNSDSGGSKLI